MIKLKSKSPKKKEKIDIGEYLEGRSLKEYLVDHTIHSQDQITPFDSSIGCTIEDAQIAYKIVCRIGVQKMNSSIEFGCYLEHLYKSTYPNSGISTWKEFLKTNALCQKTQARNYRNLTLLKEFKKFRNLNYQVNELATHAKEINDYLSKDSKQKEIWS